MKELKQFVISKSIKRLFNKLTIDASFSWGTSGKIDKLLKYLNKSYTIDKIRKYVTKNIIVKRIIYSLIFYLISILLYSNLTWEALRAKLPFINKTFYYPNLSINNWINKNKEKSNDKEKVILKIKSIIVKSELIAPSISSSGIIEPLQKVEIFSKISGRIEQIFINDSDEIIKGMKLLKLESMAYELELLKQNAGLESSRAQLKLSKEKYNTAKRNLEIRLNEADKKTSGCIKQEIEFKRAEELYNKKQSLLHEGAISEEELENTRMDLVSKDSLWQISKRDLQIAMIGLRDEDIINSGEKITNNKYEKIRILKDINTRIEKSEVELAEKSLKTNEIALKTTRMMIKESTLYSPISGFVSKIYKSSGELVNPGSAANQSIMTIVDIKKVYASFYINELEGVKIKNGMDVIIKADVYPEIEFSGKIKSISPVIDDKTHSILIKAILDNPNYLLKPGMFIRTNVIIGEDAETVLIPVDSIQPIQEKEAFAYIVKDNIIFKVKIQTGKKYGENIEVIDGLKNGDVVAIENLSILREGLKIIPVFE